LKSAVECGEGVGVRDLSGQNCSKEKPRRGVAVSAGEKKKGEEPGSFKCRAARTEKGEKKGRASSIVPKEYVLA